MTIGEILKSPRLSRLPGSSRAVAAAGLWAPAAATSPANPDEHQAIGGAEVDLQPARVAGNPGLEVDVILILPAVERDVRRSGRRVPGTNLVEAGQQLMQEMDQA